jgi:hypothetical protein
MPSRRSLFEEATRRASAIGSSGSGLIARATDRVFGVLDALASENASLVERLATPTLAFSSPCSAPDGECPGGGDGCCQADWGCSAMDTYIGQGCWSATQGGQHYTCCDKLCHQDGEPHTDLECVVSSQGMG